MKIYFGFKMIRLADYVMDFLVKNDVHDIFLLSGGGIMHLLDAVGRNKKLRYIANHHEQASATAAESYARMTNHLGACLVTTGPGGTNTVTGVAGAWLDSVPMIVISGQVKREVIADYRKIRQLGPQEINMTEIVRPITKYAVTIMDPLKIRYELEKCLYYATHDRPGPVWLNIPLDLQAAQIDVAKLKGFRPFSSVDKKNVSLEKQVIQTVKYLQHAQRPIIIAGYGIRLADAQKNFKELLKQVHAPVLRTFNAIDLIGEDEHFFVAGFGPGGQRRGNFALQNADLVISIGANLNIASIGFEYQNFAPHATKIIVNIDQGELEKKSLPVKKNDLIIKADAKDFLQKLVHSIPASGIAINKEWLAACLNWKKRYPSIEKEFFTSSGALKDKDHVNSYIFFDRLSDMMKPGDVITTGIGLDAVSLYQAFKLKKDQRAFVNKNLGQMGWGLPGAIGACVGNKRQPTVCVTGDGDLQVNVHELATIAANKLPIKLFVFNNGMYESIRTTQNNLFQGRLVGSDQTSGVTGPNLKKLAAAYELPYTRIMKNKNITPVVRKILASPTPILCEVNVSYYQKRIPKVSSYMNKDGQMRSKPLEDMFPFLPEEEISENMHLFDKKQ